MTQLARQQDTDFYKILLDNLYDGVYFVDPARRITYWNHGAERISGYPASEVVGSACFDNILMHVDSTGCHLCKEKCLLHATLEDGELREAEVYLHHREGHRVPVHMRVAPIYDDEDQIIGAVEIFSDSTPRLAFLERVTALEQVALLDHLTGVGNRRYADVELRSRFAELKRYQFTMGAIFVDIDDFKDVNDTYGHDVGDDVLRMVAATLKGNVRTSDFVCRWGGEEFLILAAHVGLAQLKQLAEKLRVLIAQSKCSTPSGPLQVTVSLGATLALPDETPAALIKRVDTLLYASKHAGKNRVTAE